MEMSKEDLILNLFNDRQSADITFVVYEEEIPVHKAILAAESSYFYAVFLNGTNEGNIRITLNETPLKQFKEVIRFCYLQKVEIGGWQTEEVCNLIRLAHEYNFECLMKEIAKEMRKQSLINPVSLPVFYDLAVALHSEQVFIAIKRCAIYSVVESEEFVGFSVDLVCFIFRVLEVGPKCIKALWKWKASHTDQQVEQVFKSIRWEKVPSYILAEVIGVLIPQANLLKVAEPAEVVNPDESELCVCGVRHCDLRRTLKP